MWASNDLSDYSASAILRDGTPVRIRAIRPNDKRGLARHFEGLGSDSRYHRFFGIKNGFTSTSCAISRNRISCAMWRWW